MRSGPRHLHEDRPSAFQGPAIVSRDSGHPKRCCAQVDWDRGEDGKKYDNAAFMIDADAFLDDKKATQMLSSYLKNAVDREEDQLTKTAIREYALRPAREMRLHNDHVVVCSVYNYVLERSGRRR